MDNSDGNGRTPATEGWGRTKIEKQTFKYTWVIDQFPLWLNEIAEEEEYSPTFSVGDHKWCLRVTTNKTDDENKDCITLGLVALQNPKSNVVAEFKLGILDDKGKCIFFRDGRTTLFQSKTKNDVWGWDQFIQKDILLNKENGYLSNDTLRLFCEINAFGKSSLSGSGSYTAPGPEAKVVFPECHLTSNFQNFLQSQFLSDVIVAVETREFPSHKVILAAASPVFAAMFGHDMKEKIESRVEIKDVAASVFEDFLNFIYTGKVAELEKKAEALLVVAERYGVERLKAICEESLVSQLSAENTLRLYELANLHNANQLKTITIKFFKENSADVSKSDEFFSLMLQEMTLTEKNS